MKTAHFLRSDLTTSQDLTADSLTYSTSIGRKFKVEQIIFNASVNITETITISIDSAKGANYDSIIRTIDLVSQAHYLFRPKGRINFQSGDKLKIECTNANTTGTIYVLIKTSEM